MSAPLSAPSFAGWATTAPKPWAFACCLNGRYLTQPTTGVQRYASEVVRQLDIELAARGGQAQMRAPARAQAPAFQAIEVCAGGASGGYVWEQCELPLREKRPILSFCNVGPIAAAGQILCIHDVNVFRCPDSYSMKFRWLYRALLPQLARRAGRLVTVSNASRRDLAEVFGLREKDIAVLPNGHEHALRWRPENSRLAVGEVRPFVLLIGSPALHKNLGVVLDLAEALDAAGLDIVVAGASASVFAAHRARVANNLRCLGRVSDDDLGWLYSHALCLAFPSRFEGFGLPLLEAMTYGCPVVTAPIASSREVCAAAALYADADDAAAWRNAFLRLAQSRELRGELRDSGRLRARAYSWAQAATGYFELAMRGRA